MTRIRATALTRTYPGAVPVTALRGAALTVPEGSITAVLGPSGCGKTTLLRALAGLERPDGGTIELGDQVVDGPGVHVPPERRRIGLVPQEGALFPHLDVAGNLGFGLQGLDRGARARRIGELLDLIGLPGYERRRPHELSGGQQQRVALARALAPSPVAVLLDEPFSALDAALRTSLRDEVAATLRATGTTALLVTHDQAEALAVADEVAVMREGAIVQVGSPVEVYRTPVDAWTARFVGDLVELPGSTAERLRACRPEQLVRSPADGAELVGRVASVRFGGPDALVAVQVDDRTVTARWPSLDLPEVDEVVGLALAGAVLDLPADPPARAGEPD